MSNYLSREQSRKIDERAMSEYGMPGLLLMENAARGCVDVLQKLGIQETVCICCGGGNNGGDGFAMARRLDLLGHRVKVLMWGDADRLVGDAAINYHILMRTDVSIVAGSTIRSETGLESHLKNVEWIVDGLLGTGFQGPLRSPMIDAIRVLNSTPAKRFAVDLPSGLDCDTGVPADPTFRADHTCTFVAEKVGFLNPAASPFLGKVHVVDIGAPRKLLEAIFEVTSVESRIR